MADDTASKRVSWRARFSIWEEYVADLAMGSLRYIDSVETDSHVYIATERVRPLEGVLRDWGSGGALAGSSVAKGKGKEDWIGWGVRGISVSMRMATYSEALSLTSPL